MVLKKLEDMLATDTENLAGGGEVTAQELLDALAEQVANKLLAKSQVVNNLWLRWKEIRWMLHRGRR